MNRLPLLLATLGAIGLAGCAQRSPPGVHEAALGHEPVRYLQSPPHGPGAVPPAGFNTWQEYHAWVETTGRVTPEAGR